MSASGGGVAGEGREEFRLSHGGVKGKRGSATGEEVARKQTSSTSVGEEIPELGYPEMRIVRAIKAGVAAEKNSVALVKHNRPVFRVERKYREIEKESVGIGEADHVAEAKRDKLRARVKVRAGTGGGKKIVFMHGTPEEARR